MNPFTNPQHFSFTNRFGGPHFNKSLLKMRIEMMNRQSTWKRGWRYVALSLLLFFTAMCQPLLQTEPGQEKASEKPVDTGIYSTKSYPAGNTHVVETYRNGKLIGKTKLQNYNPNMEYTWSGDMNQLMEASFFKRKNAMLYVRSNHHLDLYEEYKKSVTVFLDGQQVSLDELNKVHIRQIAKVYARKRGPREGLLAEVEYDKVPAGGKQKSTSKLVALEHFNRKAEDTDYVIWIERAPNRMKRDSSYYVVSPFYSGDF